ncbi:MAG: hypothetical protein NT004_10510 [Bacteroidetes bacterium]|nr:hypothetical protein [Bacteroidota bacterium]
METVVLSSSSKNNMKLLTDLARKIGITVKYLTDEEKEDIGMANAIRKGAPENT